MIGGINSSQTCARATTAEIVFCTFIDGE